MKKYIMQDKAAGSFNFAPSQPHICSAFSCCSIRQCIQVWKGM